MSNLNFYSTNVVLKYMIQERYKGGTHYVWCSRIPDARALGRYAFNSMVPASSNPVQIYQELKRDCDEGDRHSAKIIAQKSSLKGLAVKWAANGEISDLDRDDIVFMVDNASLNDWRPLIYVIPRPLIGNRARLVPASQRAGWGEEWIIDNLQTSEFDILEV